MRYRISVRLGAQFGGLLILLATLSVVWVKATIQEFASTFDAEMLRSQAGILMTYLQFDAKGHPHIHLPDELETAYANHYKGMVYMILGKDGTVYGYSTPQAVQSLRAAPKYLYEQAVFKEDDASGVDNLSVMVKEVSTPRANHELFLVVGRNYNTDQLLLADAARRTLLGMMVFMVPIYLLSVLVAVVTIAYSLRPLRVISQQAAQITPGRSMDRLNVQMAPTEVKPMVAAVNRLLDRLELSLSEQKHINADTAHQLRTPLAVMKARLEQAPAFKGKAALEQDIERMSRIIRQLLTLAYVDGQKIIPTKVDLVRLTRARMEQMVPLALLRQVKLSFDTPDGAVMVNADVYSAGEAVLNVIDNAIGFSPAGQTVEVFVTSGGAVQVMDRGPGIAEERRAYLFKRLWREDNRRDGAGLGLAIVAEIMNQHGGSVEIADRPGGGSVFTLTFMMAVAEQQVAGPARRKARQRRA